MKSSIRYCNQDIGNNHSALDNELNKKKKSSKKKVKRLAHSLIIF